MRRAFALLTLLTSLGSCSLLTPKDEFSANATVVRFSDTNEYVVETYLVDPDHSATGVTVSGTGIATPFAAIYDQYGNDNWNGPNVSLGSSTPPPLPATYEFQVTTENGTLVVRASASEYFGEFAVPTYPVSTDTAPPTGFTFSWDPAAATNCIDYQVQLDGQFWQQSAGNATALTYDGPPLSAGTHQYYIASVPIGGNTSSLAHMTFNVGP